jgi:catechol 2,3-dioxygenase-like lactoylglutathione lyase family enzyme
MTQAATQKGALFTSGFSTFAVKDIGEAMRFYGETLGLGVSETNEGMSLGIPGGGSVFVYPKGDHEPAVFTVFNLKVDDIEQAVDELSSRGIPFLQYGEPIRTDGKGIFWGGRQDSGPNIAWFSDPSGNILSIIEE